MPLTPDEVILWRGPSFALNATIAASWIVMLVLIALSWAATRRIRLEPPFSGWQKLMETLVCLIRDQIAEVYPHRPERFVPFVGTLFLYISAAGFLTLVPGFRAPTASLSTTTALALCVFAAVPIHGVAQHGLLGYLKRYLEPTPLMLPFQLLGEITRTVALAVRLFGNMLSGSLLVAILLGIAPLFVPAVAELLGLLLGQIQAYIFSVLAMVYIAASLQARQNRRSNL